MRPWESLAILIVPRATKNISQLRDLRYNDSLFFPHSLAQVTQLTGNLGCCIDFPLALLFIQQTFPMMSSRRVIFVF